MTHKILLTLLVSLALISCGPVTSVGDCVTSTGNNEGVTSTGNNEGLTTTGNNGATVCGNNGTIAGIVSIDESIQASLKKRTTAKIEAPIVYLYKSGNSTSIAMTQANETGEYNFQNLSLDTFDIVVEFQKDGQDLGGSRKRIILDEKQPANLSINISINIFITQIFNIFLLDEQEVKSIKSLDARTDVVIEESQIQLTSTQSDTSYFELEYTDSEGPKATTFIVYYENGVLQVKEIESKTTITLSVENTMSSSEIISSQTISSTEVLSSEEQLSSTETLSSSDLNSSSTQTSSSPSSSFDVLSSSTVLVSSSEETGLINDNTVAYWSFLNIQNETVPDLSLFTRNGTLNNAITSDSSTLFSGNTTSFASFASIDDLINPSNIIISTRIMLKSFPSSAEGIIAGYAKWDGATQGWEFRISSQGYPEFIVGSAGTSNWYSTLSSQKLELNLWYDLSAHFDGDYLTIKINGLETSRTAHTQELNLSNQVINVAKRSIGTPDNTLNMHIQYLQIDSE